MPDTSASPMSINTSAPKFFQGFLHFNIRCSEADLPAIEKFYGDVLDLKKGFRPNFVGPGIWLY